MLFKLEKESLDFRQWQNRREKGPMKSMVRQKAPNHVKGKGRKINEILKTPLISVPYDQCCDTEVNPARAEQGQLRDGDPGLSTNRKPNTPTKATPASQKSKDLN